VGTGSSFKGGVKVKPVVGIDVSKGESHGQAFLKKAKPFGRGFRFAHTKPGLQELLSILRELESISGERPDVILEATGHYHLPITQFLDEQGYVFILLNPLVSQRSKKSQLRKVKTDAADAWHLAELYYKEEFEPVKQKSIQMICNATL
jgi:transposase